MDTRKTFGLSVDPGQSVRVTAGGFAAGAAVSLPFTTAEMASIDLGGATAAGDGRIDIRVRIPPPAFPGVPARSPPRARAPTAQSSSVPGS